MVVVMGRCRMVSWMMESGSQTGMVMERRQVVVVVMLGRCCSRGSSSVMVMMVMTGQGHGGCGRHHKGGHSGQHRTGRSG